MLKAITNPSSPQAYGFTMLCQLNSSELAIAKAEIAAFLQLGQQQGMQKLPVHLLLRRELLAARYLWPAVAWGW